MKNIIKSTKFLKNLLQIHVYAKFLFCYILISQNLNKLQSTGKKELSEDVFNVHFSLFYKFFIKGALGVKLKHDVNSYFWD